MNLVDSAVRSVVQEFVRDGVLFTALDVSNKVKETLPLARHREVRDLVRMLYTSEIETAGYARTPITVTLENGDTAEALLYHSLVDSWDLDAKYDAQKRAQTATQPRSALQLTNPIANVVNDINNITNPAKNLIDAVNQAGAATKIISDMAKPFNDLNKVVDTLKQVSGATDTLKQFTPSRVLWDNLFKGQPSLFPRK